MKIKQLIKERRLPGNYKESGHEVVSGMTGMGKSFLVLYKVFLSFYEDKPLCYIDPKGDSYRNILAFLSQTKEGRQFWERYRHRILFVNPVAKADHIVGFNAIEPMGDFLRATPDRVALVANSMVSHIRDQSGFEMYDANRMQNIMNAGLGLLVDGGRGRYTLTEFPLLFQQTFVTKRVNGKNKRIWDDFNPFVQHLLETADHYGTRSFWDHQWANWTVQAKRDWVQSSMGRIFQYLFDDRMRYTTCTVDNATLDFDEAIEKGYWIFAHLPYPYLSDTITTVLGNILITKLFYAAMRRPPTQRPYRIYLDEARFFNTGPLSAILDTARAYNLWLTLIVQNMEQLVRYHGGRRDTRLLDSVMTNVRYFNSFKTSASDGQLFARMMFPPTGEKVRDVRRSGDPDYYPVSAEESQNIARFESLGDRELIVYDRQVSREPRVWSTPTLFIPEVDEEKLAYFEAEHLAVTGRPAHEIDHEIRDRTDRLMRLITRQTSAGKERELDEAVYGQKL